MDNNSHRQMYASFEQPGAEQPSDEHRSNSFQGHQQRYQQSPQEGEPRQPGMAAVLPVMTDAVGNRCQADGCMADLSGLRRYFRRYHVCETHIRSPEVLIGGRQVRFCDQCSTFHPLALFDGARRTCREKLEQNRMKRRMRKQLTGQHGAAAPAALPAAPASAAATAATAAGSGGGGGGGLQSDDADSDDQPGNGNGVLGTDVDDAPTHRGQSRKQTLKRPSATAMQGGRRPPPVARPSTGMDVTKVYKIQRESVGQEIKVESQSPETEDDEMQQRRRGPGAGLCDEGGWTVMDVKMDAGGAFGGGTLQGRGAREAGSGGSNKRGRPGEPVALTADWARLNQHDLRDQEQLQAVYGPGRDGGMYPQRGQSQPLGPQGPHALRQQPFKGQHVALPQLPQQQQQSLPTGNWEVATGGVISLERLPRPAVQGTWRQHGGSLPNMGQELSGSSPRWMPPGEARVSWHSLPTGVLAASGMPTESHTLTEKPPRDREARMSLGHSISDRVYQAQTQGPQSQGGGGFPAPNSFSGSEPGFGYGSTSGPLGRGVGRVGTHVDSGDGAPAVPLLAQVMRTDPDLRRQAPRLSQPGPDAIAPAKHVEPSGRGSGGGELGLPGADGLTPAQQAALQLQFGAGLFRGVVVASKPQPSSGANVPKQWLAVPLTAQQQQQLQRQELTGYGDVSGSGTQGPEVWMGNGTTLQGGSWMDSHGPQFMEAHGELPIVGTASLGAFQGQMSLLPPAANDDRRMSAGSSIYTADEEAQAGEVDDQVISRAVDEAEAVASGMLGGANQQPIEEAPSLLNTQSFKEDIDRDNANAMIWETRQRQQQHMQLLAEHQQQKQQQVQIVVSIPNRHNQLQSFQGEQRVKLLDQIHQEESQRHFKLVQQPAQQQQPSLLQQHIIEHGMVSNINFSRSDNWQQAPPQHSPQPRPQLQTSHKDAAANSFGRLYEQHAYPVSAFHIQGPVDDLDADNDYPHLPPQQGNAIAVRTGTSGGNGQGALTAVGQSQLLGGGGASGAAAAHPRSPAVPAQKQWNRGASTAWGPANRAASGPQASYDVLSHLQTRSQGPSVIGPGTQQRMQQLGSSLAGVALSDQELILSTLMNLAANPPRAVTAGQERGPMGPSSLPHARDGQERGGVDPSSGGGSAGMYALQQDRRGGAPQPLSQEQQPQGAAPGFSLRPDSTSALPDGVQQLALGETELQTIDSVVISEAFRDPHGSLQLLDSVELAQMQDLRVNAVPSSALGECGAIGVQGGPPTPPPRGSDGLVNGQGGVDRAPMEEDRWVGASSDIQIEWRSWQQQQQGRLARENMDSGDLISSFHGSEGLRSLERQQQQQLRQERVTNHTALLGNDRRLQQQQPSGYRPQSWSHQAQHPEDMGDRRRTHSMYGMQYDTDRCTLTGPGAGVGGQNLSHVALKLSHARPDTLRSDLVERIQEGVRGGGAAVLPAALREGCVEVLVEVMHSCPTSELCKRLFHLPVAGGANLTDLDLTAAAAMSAKKQLREWVGAEVFDTCERVTMQLMGGPVLDCSQGSTPKLRMWKAAMHQAGLSFAAEWPNMLVSGSGPPVLVADTCKAQQIQLHGPSELESQLGLVQLNVRTSGGACSLGTAEAVSIPSEGADFVEAVDAKAARITRPGAPGCPAWQEPPAAISCRSLDPPAAAPGNPVAPVTDNKAHLLRDLSQQKLRNVSSSPFVAPLSLSEVRGAYRWLTALPDEARSAGADCDREGSCFAVSRESDGEAAAKVKMSPWGSQSSRDSAMETVELLRSCFLTAQLPSSQPSSPIPVPGPQRHQEHHPQGCSPAGPLTPVGKPNGATTQRKRAEQQQQRVSYEPVVQQQRQGHALPDSDILMRNRSKSDDGYISGNLQCGGTSGSCTPRAPVGPLECKSPHCQMSSRRRPMQGDVSGNATVPATAGVAPGSVRSPDWLPGRASICSTATLTIDTTLQDRLSSRSSSTVVTNGTTLYDRTSLRSEWSCLSTLTSFGGALGSAGGAVVGSSGSGGGAAAPYAAVSRSRDLSGLSTCAGTLSSCFGQSLGYGLRSPGTRPVWISAAEGVRSTENGGPLSTNSEGCRQQRPAALGADDVVRHSDSQTLRPPQHTCVRMPCKPHLAQPASDHPELHRELTVLTPRPVKAPLDSSSLPTAAAIAVAAAPAAVEAALPISHCNGMDECDHRRQIRPHISSDVKSNMQLLQLNLPVLPGAGLALLEATAGHTVASCWPLLVVETEAQRKELMHLWRELVDAGRQDVWRVLASDLGLVLGNLPRRALAHELDLLRCGAGSVVSSDTNAGSPQQLSVPSMPVASGRRPGGANADADAEVQGVAPGPFVRSIFSAAAMVGAMRLSFSEGNEADRHEADSSLPLSQQQTNAAATATAATATAATWPLQNHSGAYCDSLRSVESTYQESWGTGMTQRSAVSEEAAHPSPLREATRAAASSNGSGSGSGREGGRSGFCSTSSNSDSDSIVSFTADPELCDIIAVVAANGSDVDGGIDADATYLCMLSASEADLPSPSSTAGEAFAFNGALVPIDPESQEVQTQEVVTAGKQQAAPVAQVCVLQRRDEVRLASELNSGCNGSGIGDLSMAVVTKFLEGLRVTIRPGDVSREVPSHNGDDAEPCRTSGMAGCDIGMGSATAASAVEVPPAGVVASGKMARVKGSEEQQAQEVLGAQAQGKTCAARGPMLPPAAAIGLSREARAALQGALSRLRGFLNGRRAPALWELLTRVEAGDAPEVTFSSLAAKVPSV